MKHKLFTLLLALMASTGTIFAETVQIGDLYYNIYSYYARVTSQNSEYPFWTTDTLTSISIPASITYNNKVYNVTGIDHHAFHYCNNLTSVVIPNSVTYIADMAFYYCSNLTSVEMSDNIKSIDYDAFTNCKSLINVALPNSLTSIGNRAFSMCSGLTSITIPNNVKSIGNSAFYACNGLTSVTIPNSVTSIGEQAFRSCRSLTAINVAADNPNYCSIDGVLYDKTQTTLIQCPGGKQGEYTIPNSVTSIGKSACESCSSLTSITIPNSVISIGEKAFLGCKGLTSVIIPNGITSIGEEAFCYCDGITSVTISNSVTSIGRVALSYCENLTDITVATDNPSYCSVDGILFNKAKTILIQCPGAKQGVYAIPNSVTSIGNNAFSNCKGLTSVSIPNSVTSIEKYAFYGCKGLTSITIPNSVTSIGDYALSCQYHVNVTNYATVPQTITASVFSSLTLSACTLYVPAESVEAYKAADVWKNFGNIQAIDESTEITYTSIADLYNMAQDSTFTLGAFDVVYVPDFQNGANMYIKDETGSMVIYKPNYGLQAGDHVEAGLQGRINIYHGLYEVAPVSAKEDLTVTAGDAPAPMVATEVPSATNVNQFVVYKNVSFATDTAFVESKRHAVHGTWNNQQITFYNQYYIGAMLSANKTYNITAVNTIYGTTPQAYPLAVEEVTTDTIEPCHTISGTCGTNLTWELSCDSVLTISGTGAMVDNPSWSPYVSLIKAVIMPEGLTIIGRNAFAECVNLESAHIPESVTAIGPAAFYNCSALTSINMPDSVRMLGHKAFVGCESLTEPVYNAHIFGFMPRNYCGAYSIPEGIVSVAAYAFCGIASAMCSGLTEITIPSSVKRLGVEAFGLLFLRKITCLAVTPPTCDSTTFEWYHEETGITVKVDRSIPVYVPAESVDAYKAADVWKEFFNILPIGGTIEPQDSIYDVVYLDQAGLQLDYEPVTLHLPEAPQIEGFTFLKWQVVAGDLENGIHIQAVYTANEPTNAPEVYTNPANKAQKLIRNGKVYILTDDKVYSVTGQKVK